MILITTSDYLPRLGGLTTFTINIENVFKELGISYELFHWNSVEEIVRFCKSDLTKYKFIVNIHPQFAWLAEGHHERMINFIHGSEILMTSQHPLKKVYKIFFKKKLFGKLGDAYLNIFISEATLKKAISTGFIVDYSRDVILHNCIDVKDAQFIHKNPVEKLVFTCIVRNVPHKNLKGALSFCELTHLLTAKEVELIVPGESNLKSSLISIKELKDKDNSCRDEAYKNAHYNLLLSTDNTAKGFFEGFGLTVLEAGRFATPSIVLNTGGLPEAVHHGETGWVINEVNSEAVNQIFNSNHQIVYRQLASQCYSHTVTSHSLKEYQKIFNLIFESRGAA